MASLVGQTVSHYKILEHLGGGGMGVVYKAEDTRLKRTVALKFLSPALAIDPESKERFIREAQAASALQQHNICIVHDIDETADGQMFIVMDFYDGETLNKKIGRGPLPIDEAVGIAFQIAAGLAKAHEHGIVHRDIKPANIIVTNEGTAKILDFGLAKLSGRTLFTKSGTTMGTAAYMSPEQARGDSTDSRTDLWSLGAILYEMVAGHKPFESDYEQALVYSILNEEPEAVEHSRADVPDSLGKVVRRAMGKDLRERYQTAGEFLTDLEALREGRKPSKQTVKLSHKKRRLLLLAGTAVIVLLALAILSVIHFRATAGTIDAIAVLPPEDLSNDPRNEPLALGLADELISRLYQVSSLRVPSFRSVLSFRGTQKTVAEIGKELSVGALVTWTILRSGETIRLHVQVIEAATDRPLWSKGYDRPMGDLIQLQTDVAQDIVKELKIALTPQEKTQLAVARKVDPKAYELYLEARRTWYNPTANEHEYHAAVESLEQAIAIDPSYPAFYSLTAMFYQDGPARGYYKPVEVIPSMQKLVQAALSLEERNADCQVALAMLDMIQWDWKGAEAAFLCALEFSPGNPETQAAYGALLLWLGRSEEALARLKRAYEIDPSMKGHGTWMVGWYCMARRYDDAIALGTSALQRFPEDPLLHIFLACSYAPKGMCDSAFLHAERSLALNASAGELWIEVNCSYVYSMCGQYKKAQELLDLYLSSRKGKSTEPYWVAAAYSLLGDTSNAYIWLEKAYNDRSPSLELLKVDNSWDGQRSNPRYRDMLKRIGLDR